jgi:hypothetical protein
MSKDESKTEDPRHVSELPTAQARFLARVVDQAFDDGWRSAEDFLRHFPPQVIVESLKDADTLRVRLLVESIGIPERMALKKSISSAAEDLALALDEEVTTPAKILALYPPDDKVRYLDPKALFAFYTEDAFFDITKGDAKHAQASERMAFVLEVALDEQLLTLGDIADGITFERIAEHLPTGDLRKLMVHAMQLGRSSTPLTEEHFTTVVSLPHLMAHVPLAHTWKDVALAKLAQPAGFVEAPDEIPPSSSVEDATPSDIMAAVEEASNPAAALAPADEAPPPLPSGGNGAAPDAGSEPTTEEDTARRRVLDRLRLIERLPPNAGELPTPMLLSIESMYADLAAAAGDDEREAAIEEAFPNQTHMRTAMLGLIQLLDPSVDTNDPVIRDAEVGSLMKIVLFEERRRLEPRRSSPYGSTPPSGPASSQPGKRRSIPPISRQSSPPPPPRAEARSKRSP